MIIKEKRYQMVKANPIFGMNDLMKEYLNFIVNRLFWFLVLKIFVLIFIIFPHLNPLEVFLSLTPSLPEYLITNS